MKKATSLIIMTAAALLCVGQVSEARGQDAVDVDVQRAGSLTVDLGYWMHPDVTNSGLMVRTTAMAVDVVPDTFVGRFGELRAGIGADFEGELLPYEFSFKLGVGFATDYFVLFAATGLNMDGFQSLSEESDAKGVPFGVGIPLVLGLWITPMELFHVYAMAEPAWYPWVESRQVTVSPLDIGEEFRSRLGVGVQVQEVSLRFEYMHYQVSPSSYHMFMLGAGFLPDI